MMRNLVVLLLFFTPFVLKAQTTTLPAYWGITFHVGAFASGVPVHLEEAMKNQGYFAHSGGLFGGGPALPMAKRTMVRQVGLEKNWRKHGIVKLLYSTFSGKLSGISSNKGELNLGYKVRTTVLLGGIHLNKGVFRVAVGPAWHFISVNGDRPFDSQVSQNKNYPKLGFGIESGLRFPAEGLVFVDVNVQYQKVGKIHMGTYTFEDVDPVGQPQVTSFDAGEKSFSYLAFNFGIGVRLAWLSTK